MKKIHLIVLVFLISISATKAQQKKPVTIKIQTPGAMCVECKNRIEEFMKYEDGVTKVVVYPSSKYTNVSYLVDRTNVENIKTAIANIGYDADEIKPNPDAYTELPLTCKKPDDGGHKKH